VAISVADIVAVPFVKMRFHAGRAGGGRLVTWAHASDLPNATDWLAAGDLLMCNGLSFPADAKAQAAFLTTLDAADLSGFAIGDDMAAPPLTADFLARADELAFPVLGIPHEVPFVAISRVVANANSGEEHGRLVRTLQLYECLRGGVSTGRLGAPLLSELSRQLTCRLVLLDTGTGLPVLPTDQELPQWLRERLVEELRARKGVFPGVLRIRHDDDMALAIRVPASRATALVALHEEPHQPDLALLQHAANIAALEVERIHVEREQRRRLGRELFGQLLNRSVEPTSALHQLSEHGVSPDEAVFVAFGPGVDDRDKDLHHELALRQVPHLLLSDPKCGLAILMDSETAVGALRSALGGDVALGVSDPLGRPDRAPDAAREARWAQTAAQTLGRALVRYGEGTPLFLPRTLGEAATAADRILGPLIAYDEEHTTDLLHSLAVFLEHNRSWQRAAETLHVHKQTLVYRMHRVERLTGRDLRDTGDVVQFWLALRALEFAQGDVMVTAGSGA
jgi:PucR family transcriptional regulator, purine catabolism regulatory protein